MRLEPIIAIVIGSLIGMGVAFAIWSANKPAQIPEDTSIETTSTELLEPSDTVHEDFSVDLPSNTFVSATEEIQISGTARANSILTIVSQKNSEIKKVQEDGTFESNILLSGGLNRVIITQYDTSDTDTITLDIVYSNQVDGEELAFFSGTITDIAQEAIQIRTTTGEISLFSMSDSAAIVNIIDDPEEIDVDELAIGDYVISIGTLTTEESLSAQRVLVTTEANVRLPQSIQGTVTELSSSEFIIEDSEGTPHSLDARGGIDVFILNDSEISDSSFSEIDLEDTIIITGTPNEDSEIDVSQILITSNPS